MPSVDLTDRLATAAARMRTRRAAALAVMDGERLAGIVSEHDVLRAVADGLSTDVLQVADYMRPQSGAIEAADRAWVAAQRMIEQGVRHLPVVREGRIVGVISASDLLGEWNVPLELVGSEPW